MEASTYCSSSRSAASSNHLPNLGCHHLKRCTFHVCGIRAGNTPSKLADLLRPSKRMDLSRPSIDLYKVKYHLFLRSYGASGSMWLKMHAHRTSKLGNVMCNKANLCIWDSNSNPKHGRVMPAMAMPSLFAEADEGNVVEEAAEKDCKYYMDNMSLVMENAENGVDGEVGAKGASSNAGAKGAGSNAGMAEAFNISSKTAFGITATVSLAALLLPLLMNSVTGALTLKTKVLSYVTLLCGFYMAWNIGANDVANAMGTSVGSGALTLRQAVLIAAVLEFSGSFLVGSHVSHTMQKGILTAGFFNGKDSLLFCGMLSSLAAAGTWLQVASSYGWPVSTTHCIVGALVGFGLIYGGVEAVYWSSLARVVSSWVISPCMGAVMSFSVYKLIRMFVYSAPNPGQAAATVAPIAVFVGVVAFSLTAFPMTGNPLFVVARALACGSLGSYLMKAVIKREFGSLLGAYCEVPSDVKVGKANGLMGFLQDVGGPIGSQLRVVYGVFGYLQVLSACFMSFAHGANDVSNAIGPISAALAILHGTGLGGGGGGLLAIGTDVLAWGGFGIVAGLLVWGYRVIATIGKKITELTPTRGFAAEFAAATVVVVASRLGLPISATHTLVGAVMGVGFARGFNNVRRETVREIVASWIITIPVGALLSVFYTLLLTRFLTGGL